MLLFWNESCIMTENTIFCTRSLVFSEGALGRVILLINLSCSQIAICSQDDRIWSWFQWMVQNLHMLSFPGQLTTIPSFALADCECTDRLRCIYGSWSGSECISKSTAADWATIIHIIHFMHISILQFTTKPTE